MRSVTKLTREAIRLLGRDEAEQLVRIASWRAGVEYRRHRRASLSTVRHAYVCTALSNAILAERRARGYLDRYAHEPRRESVPLDEHVDSLRRLREVALVAPTLTELGQGWLLRELGDRYGVTRQAMHLRAQKERARLPRGDA